MVLPGFIDAHSHADGRLADRETARALLRQGVTTVVVGQDGVSFAPTTDETAGDLETYFSAVNGPRPAGLPDACGIGRLLETYDAGSFVNAAVLVPAGNVRAAVLGFQQRPADPAEIRRMQDLVEVGLADGAVGLSTGLEYVPGGFASPDELAALCGAVADAGAVHVSHMRGYEAAAATGLSELRALAERSGVATHVSHLHAPMAVIGDLLDAADEGWDLTFDTYPYLRGSTLLAMLVLPAALQADGPRECLSRLAEAETRAELARDWFPSLGDLFSRITLTYVADPALAWMEGHGLADAAETVGVPVAELVCRLLIEARLGVGCMVQQPPASSEDDVRALLADPRHLVGSDGIFMGSHPHPRARGAIARFVARHVLGLRDWTWGQAAQHLSTHAVDRFALGDRGRIRPGAIADIAVLDPSMLADRASYESPLELATGVDLVLIGGQLALRDGELYGDPVGRSIRRERP